jgi:hypothetical protein
MHEAPRIDFASGLRVTTTSIVIGRVHCAAMRRSLAWENPALYDARRTPSHRIDQGETGRLSEGRQR